MHGRFAFLKFVALAGGAVGVWLLGVAFLADQLRTGWEAVNGGATVGLAFYVAWLVRIEAARPFERGAAKVAMAAAMLTAAWCAYCLFVTPFDAQTRAISQMTLLGGVGKYGVVEAYKAADLSRFPAFILNMLATLLAYATVARNGRILLWLLKATGLDVSGMARKANGELADSGWLNDYDAVDASMSGGYIMGQLDVTLNPDRKRRKEKVFGRTEMSEVSPEDMEAEMASGRHGHWVVKAVRRILGMPGKARMSQLIAKLVESHVLIIGASGAGKGLGLITNLLAPIIEIDGTTGLTWWARLFNRYFAPDSMKRVVKIMAGWVNGVLFIDPKGEAVMVALLARLRLGRKVRLIDPFGLVAKYGAKPGFGYLRRIPCGNFNPLDIVPNDEFYEADADVLDLDREVDWSQVRVDPDADDRKKFVTIINSMMDPCVPMPTGDAGNAKHFIDGARTIGAGLIAAICSLNPKVRNPVTGKWDIPYERSLTLLNELIYNTALLDAMLMGKGFPVECYVDGDEEKGLKPEYKDWNLADPAWLKRGGGLPFRAAGKYQKAGEENERPGFISTLQNSFAWLNDPIMRRHVAKSDFDLDDWFANKEDLFLTVAPGDIEMIKGYLRIWAAMPILLGPIKQDIIKKRLSVVVDEAPLFGRLQAIVQAFGVMRGYNISYYVAAQTRSQLEKEYTKEDCLTLIGNSELVGMLKAGPGDEQMQKWVSDACGKTTMVTETVGYSAGLSGQSMSANGGGFNEGLSRNRNLQQVDLITPAEVGQMADGDIISLWCPKNKPRKPIRIRTAKYFLRPETSHLALPNPIREEAIPPSKEIIEELDALLSAIREDRFDEAAAAELLGAVRSRIGTDVTQAAFDSLRMLLEQIREEGFSNDLTRNFDKLVRNIVKTVADPVAAEKIETLRDKLKGAPPESLVPPALRGGFADDKGQRSGGPMKLDKKQAEALLPYGRSGEFAASDLPEWEDSVPAIPDMSFLTRALDEAEDDGLLDNAAFGGDMDDEVH